MEASAQVTVAKVVLPIGVPTVPNRLGKATTANAIASGEIGKIVGCGTGGAGAGTTGGEPAKCVING